MTYLDALLEAEAALQVRRRWYTRTRVRPSWTKSNRRAAELDVAIERIRELLAAARETGL